MKGPALILRETLRWGKEPGPGAPAPDARRRRTTMMTLVIWSSLLALAPLALGLGRKLVAGVGERLGPGH